MKNLIRQRVLLLATFLVTIVLMSSCQKFVEIPAPVGQLSSVNTFENDATASSAITGIYSRLSESPIIQSITPLNGLYADEIINFTDSYQSEFAISQLSLNSSPAINANIWNSGYQFIYQANAAIDQLFLSQSVSPELKLHLSAEARFIRAYIYLSLVNLFGDVPLITSGNYQINMSKARSPHQEVIGFIVADLEFAITHLPEQPAVEKIRADRYSAMALLARIQLYQKNYEMARQLSNTVIESKKYSLVTDPSRVFLRNSSEAIFQLYPTKVNQNTPDGLTFLPASNIEVPKYLLTADLLNAFEPGDLRKTSWTMTRSYLGQNLTYPAKYKVLNTAALSEYLVLLRLSEQYLIRAEANIYLGNVTSGISDINLIRKRARQAPSPLVKDPIPELSLQLDKESALLALEKERRIELMLENGHRWFDLRRTNRANTVLQQLKPATWETNATVWPIPIEQIRLNPFLTQNAGYFN